MPRMTTTGLHGTSAGLVPILGSKSLKKSKGDEIKPRIYNRRNRSGKVVIGSIDAKLIDLIAHSINGCRVYGSHTSHQMVNKQCIVENITDNLCDMYANISSGDFFEACFDRSMSALSESAWNDAEVEDTRRLEEVKNKLVNGEITDVHLIVDDFNVLTVNCLNAEGVIQDVVYLES